MGLSSIVNPPLMIIMDYLSIKISLMNVIGFLHPTWCSILRYFAQMLHLNGLSWDISNWNSIYNSMHISVVSKRHAVVVRKH